MNMAKVDQTAQQVGELLRDVEFIADKLRNTKAEMLTEGPATIAIDVSTANRYLTWLKDWSETVASTRRKAHARMKGAEKHSQLRSKR